MEWTMRFDRVLAGAFFLVALIAIWSCRPTVCEPGSTQLCVCPGELEGAQECDQDGTRWGSCDCLEGDDDDSVPDDDDVQPDDDDVQPDDDDVQPDDDDVQPDDDDVQPDDDDVQPDDDDVQPDDDDVQPDDDDVQPDDDDDSVMPDDDDDGTPPEGPSECSDGAGNPDQSLCDDPTACPFALGCTCWDGGGGFWFCAPNCNTTADCPTGGLVSLTCDPVEGVCIP